MTAPEGTHSEPQSRWTSTCRHCSITFPADHDGEHVCATNMYVVRWPVEMGASE